MVFVNNFMLRSYSYGSRSGATRALNDTRVSPWSDQGACSFTFQTEGKGDRMSGSWKGFGWVLLAAAGAAVFILVMHYWVKPRAVLVERSNELIEEKSNEAMKEMVYMTGSCMSDEEQEAWYKKVEFLECECQDEDAECECDKDTPRSVAAAMEQLIQQWLKENYDPISDETLNGLDPMKAIDKVKTAYTNLLGSRDGLKETFPIMLPSNVELRGSTMNMRVDAMDDAIRAVNNATWGGCANTLRMELMAQDIYSSDNDEGCVQHLDQVGSNVRDISISGGCMKAFYAEDGEEIWSAEEPEPSTWNSTGAGGGSR